LETFSELKSLIHNPRYHEQRRAFVDKLDMSTIDAPIVELIGSLSKLRYCFTLQSCYGHFLHERQRDPNNIELLPITETITVVDYRIAYIALCLQESESGRKLFDDLSKIPAIDPEYIQFGCAEWFWKRQVNSYALQVEPHRHMTKDKISVAYQEALHIEKIRGQFFRALKGVVQKRSP
jgi:hypothetical protein